jgi:hypothetical protein
MKMKQVALGMTKLLISLEVKLESLMIYISLCANHVFGVPRMSIPICHDSRIESMPISYDEIYRLNYNRTKWIGS